MAVCGSLRSLLDSPMPPESQTLVEPLSSSWDQTHSVEPPIEAASDVAEIFSELYFREKRTVLEPPSVDANGRVHVDKYQKLDSSLGGYSSKSHEPLHMCTEGLGSESSSSDVDDLIMTENEDVGRPQSLKGCTRKGYWNAKPSAKSAGRVFPPPISSIGKGGVCLRPYREDGRFILRETRIPCRELLHASREDGRLKLHFVHPDKEAATEEEEEEEEEEWSNSSVDSCDYRKER